LQIKGNFAAADGWLEDFVANQEFFPGGSMIIVDKRMGTIHKSAFGNLTEDSVVLLASLSKVPAVTLLMALDRDDGNVDFDIQQPITRYLPWLGVWDPAIPGTPADTAFDYGGSQWQIAGAVAELVGGGTWDQLWNQYIAEPCGMQVARYGNLLASPELWDGNPDSLVGVENPSIEAGMISNLDDYARIISLHLNGGTCGENQVLSPEAVEFMREVRTGAVGSGPGAVGSPPDWGYAMGWWIYPPKEGGSVYLYMDPGLFGSVAWIDVEREYGGVVFFEEYAENMGGVGSGSVIAQLIPIIEEAIDAVR